MADLAVDCSEYLRRQGRSAIGVVAGALSVAVTADTIRESELAFGSTDLWMQVDFSWDAGSPPPDSYNLYIGTASGVYDYGGSPYNVVSPAKSLLLPPGTYYWQVTSVEGETESDPTDEQVYYV